ncbi:MAG TPA: hypothetical protein VHS06_11160 [Chloroflexota bacterium]|nr:hypothetical protein [Chloroflexota bacterium]
MQTAQGPETLTGKLLYASSRTGDYDIYIQTLGLFATTRRVARSTAADSQPAWSRDASRIAFVSDRSGRDQIYVVNTAGTGLQRLTFTALFDREPTWSPDGTRIAFSRGSEIERAIWTMAGNGTGLRRLTPARGYATHPSWSPDGTRIAYARTSPPGTNLDVWSMSATDGSGLLRMTRNVADDANPQYSPDGQWIAFESKRDNAGGLTSIWRMKADGTGEIRVTSNANDFLPAWSPDGRRLVFQRALGAGSQLVTVSTTGISPIQLTNSLGFNVYANWAN